MNHSRNSGFTLVELMLAMGFVSALLLAIAMTVIQIGNTYNRGITFKSVNQAGNTIANELQRSINSSSQFDISTDTDGIGENYVTKTWGGRLCLGQYSYVWNYGEAISDPDPNAPKNVYSGTDYSDTIRFIKVIDADKSICDDPQSTIDKTTAVELLEAGQNDLAIHSFTITTDSLVFDSNTGQQLYSIGFLIGTNDQTAIGVDNKSCLLADDANSDPSYCAINQFDIVVRAGNTTN